MAALSLSKRASDELYEEAECLGANSPAQAKASLDAVFEKADLLRSFPELGRMVPEYRDPTIRELFYRHYRIFYSVEQAGELVAITSEQSGRFPLQALR